MGGDGVADVSIALTGGVYVAPTGGDGRAVPTIVLLSTFRVVVSPVAVNGSAVGDGSPPPVGVVVVGIFVRVKHRCHSHPCSACCRRRLAPKRRAC